MEQDERGRIGFRDENGSTVMKLPDEVSEIPALRRPGMGHKAIAKKLEMSKTTVKRYLHAGGWIEYKVLERPRSLDGLGDWLKAQMRKHGNNAEVIRQEPGRKQAGR